MLRPVGIVLVVAALVLGVAGPAFPGSDDAANRLLVETVKLVEQAEATESPGARAVLYERALENVDEIVAQHPGSDVAVRLATGQAIGNLSRAEVERRWRLSLAEQCVTDWDRLCLLAHALSMTEAMEDNLYHAWALMLIAEGQAVAGAFDTAIITANSITDLFYRALALGEISKSVTETGAEARAHELFADARALAGSIQDPFRRSWAFAEIAGLLGDAGDKQGAREIVQRAREAAEVLEDAWQRATAIAAIANAQVEAGDTVEGRESLLKALEISSAIKARHLQVDALTRVASMQGEIGDRVEAHKTITQARQLTETVWDPMLRDQLLRWIVDAQANNGDIAQAFATAGKIKSQSWQAVALVAIGDSQLELGAIDHAHRTVNLAFQAIKALRSESEAALPLAFLGWAMKSPENCKLGNKSC